MATIRPQSGSFQAIVRMKGIRVVKTFDTKTKAKFWAKDVETQINDGTWIEVHKQKAIDLHTILQWSIDQAQSQKAFGKSKLAAMRKMQREIGHLTLDQLTVENVVSYATTCRRDLAASTVTQYLSYCAKAVRRAQQVQRIPLRINPFVEASDLLKEEKLTGASNERDRRPTDEELALIDQHTDGWLRSYCFVALDSAMRQGEIHALRKDDLDLTKDLILVRNRKDKDTDEGRDMVIPMFGPTREVLLREYKASNQESAINHAPKLAASVSDSWSKFRKTYLPSVPTKDDRLRFHDFRHEAISRLFEKNWDIPEVAAVSGHRDWSQLKRYTNLKPENLVNR